MSLSSDSSVLVTSTTRPTVDQVNTIRQQFYDLSSDYYMLHGEFDKKNAMIQFDLQNEISWYDYEKRCQNLLILVRNLGPAPGTSSVANITTEYIDLTTVFEQIKDRLSNLRVRLEGCKGHRYSGDKVSFRIIGNQANATTSQPKESQNRPSKQNSKKLACKKNGEKIQREEKVPPKPYARNSFHKLTGKQRLPIDNKDSPKNMTGGIDSSPVLSAKFSGSKVKYIFMNPVLGPVLTPGEHSKSSTQPASHSKRIDTNSTPRRSHRQPLSVTFKLVQSRSSAGTTLSSAVPHRPQIDTDLTLAQDSPQSAAVLQEQVRQLEADHDLTKTSLKILNQKNDTLRQTILEQNIKSGQDELQILRLENKILDYRGFASELAAVVNRHDPNNLQERGELIGQRRLIELSLGTKIWVHQKKQGVDIQELENDSMKEGRKLLEKGDREVGMEALEREGIDEKVRPAKRRKSDRNQ